MFFSISKPQYMASHISWRMVLASILGFIDKSTEMWLIELTKPDCHRANISRPIHIYIVIWDTYILIVAPKLIYYLCRAKTSTTSNCCISYDFIPNTYLKYFNHNRARPRILSTHQDRDLIGCHFADVIFQFHLFCMDIDVFLLKLNYYPFPKVKLTMILQWFR